MNVTDPRTGRYIPIDPLDLLWAGTTFSAGCWEYNAEPNSKGYTRVAFRRDGKRIRRLAHKIAFEAEYGPLDAGMIVRHRCDNKRCVRWDHLTQGTYSQNGMDASRRGRLRGRKLRGPDKHPRKRRA